MDPVIVIVFIIYMLFVMLLGFYAGKFNKSIEGYFLADRKVGA